MSYHTEPLTVEWFLGHMIKGHVNGEVLGSTPQLLCIGFSSVLQVTILLYDTDT